MIKSYILGYREFKASTIPYLTCLIWQLIPSHCIPWSDTVYKGTLVTVTGRVT